MPRLVGSKPQMVRLSLSEGNWNDFDRRWESLPESNEDDLIVQLEAFDFLLLFEFHLLQDVFFLRVDLAGDYDTLRLTVNRSRSIVRRRSIGRVSLQHQLGIENRLVLSSLSFDSRKVCCELGGVLCFEKEFLLESKVL